MPGSLKGNCQWIYDGNPLLILERQLMPSNHEIELNLEELTPSVPVNQRNDYGALPYPLESTDISNSDGDGSD